ncbi:MAG: radical SAM protein [Candidatus Omnitrophica bacterium]|nr:radical SAM protein [Candidatus Omnitrophota bacterium]
MMQSESFVVKQDINKVSLWKSTKPLLGRLDIEITERCNNNCIHCCINLPADDADVKERELSAAEIKSILKEAASLQCIEVRFTGGEPLLREDFEEVYIFARRLGLKVLLFTNATLITPHLAGLFAHTPPLKKIEVTVYGMKKSSYESVTRVKGSFESAWQGIHLLMERKIPFVVKGALLPANKNEIGEFETWAATIPGMDKPPTHSMFFDLRCRRDDGEKNRLIEKLRMPAQEGLSVLTRREDNYVKAMKEFCPKFMRPAGDRLFSCGSGKGSGCVDAYGKFQPCLLLRHPDCAYDLRGGNLRDALGNFFPKMRERKATDPEYIAKCARCFLKGLCEQCPAKSWTEHGTLDTPVEYLCAIAHTQARFLGLLKKDEKAWEIKDWQERIQGLAKGRHGYESKSRA